MAICGVFVSKATSRMAIETGVAVAAIRTSALSSLIILRAFFTPAVGSVASSSTIHFTFSPAMVLGSRATVFFSGMPREAAGPVAETLTPTVMSARAAPAVHSADSKSASLRICICLLLVIGMDCGRGVRRNVKSPYAAFTNFVKRLYG
jgi:hypothetical protein